MFHFWFQCFILKTLWEKNKNTVGAIQKHCGSGKALPQCFEKVSVSAMLVYTRQKNIAQVFILERYFFVSIYLAAIPGTYLAVFLVAALLLCL